MIGPGQPRGFPIPGAMHFMPGMQQHHQHQQQSNPPGGIMNWSIRPFSHEEHSAFLDAMERYGQESTGNEWEKIAQAVGNRTPHEIRMHAHDYFVNLQMVTQVEPDARVLGSKIKRDDWTFEQDMVFEHAMAEFEETDPLRWLKVASLLPGKNHDDVRHRYQRLIYDVHKIENAMPMEVKYKTPKPGKSLLDKVAAKSSIKPKGPRGSGAHKGGDKGEGSGDGVAGKRASKGRGGSSKAKEKAAASARESDDGKDSASSPKSEGKPMKSGKLAGKGGKIKGKGGAYLLSKSSSPRSAATGGASLKRSAAHLANLKRARVDDDSLSQPASPAAPEPKRGTEMSMRTRGRGKVDAEPAGETGTSDATVTRKSMRSRKRRQTDDSKGDGDTEDENDGPNSQSYRR